MIILEDSEYKQELRRLFSLFCSAEKHFEYKNPHCSRASVRRQSAAFRFAKSLNAIDHLRYFFSKEGDCKKHPLLFGGIYFEVFTNETYEYTLNQLKLMNNNQDREISDKAHHLVDGWIYEYILIKIFGLQKTGTDSNFLLKIDSNKDSKKDKKNAHEADLLLGNHKVEIMADSGGFILNKNTLDFRYGKWDSLLGEESYVFNPLGNEGKYFFYHMHELNNILSKKHNVKIFNGMATGTRTSGWDKLRHHDINYDQISNHFNYIQYGTIKN
jgi:hypothetical protein